MFNSVAYAKTFEQVVFDINKTVLNPLIQFAFVVAFVVFIWGVMQFIRNANNPEGRKKGQDHMFWGIIGLVIMLGVFGIVNLLINTFGLSKSHKIDGEQQTFIPPAIKDLNISK